MVSLFSNKCSGSVALEQGGFCAMVKTLKELHYSREQIELLLNSKSGTFGVNFFVPILFFVIFFSQIPLALLGTWLSLQFIVFFIRIKLRDKGLKALQKLDRVEIRCYFHYYLVTIFFNALLWGMASALVLEYTDLIFYFIYMIMLLGLGAAGTSTLGIVFHAIFIFLVNSLIVAASIGFYYATDSTYYIFNTLFLIYFFFLLKISFRNHAFMAQNIRQKNEITKSHNLVKESIEYAELIQKAMLPKEELFRNYFKDSFVYLKQRDIVGGDFYSVISLDEHTVVVMVLDSVGHGVSGAFMTMLIKATEHQIGMEIANGQLEPRPSYILLRFNELIKDMTHNNGDTKAIIGFDGGLFYFDKRASKVYYAGARMPLYVMQENELKYYRGSRKGIGFTRTPIAQQFEEYEIEVKENTKFYFTSDGLLDQEGKEGLPYGKERFKTFLQEHHTLALSEQSEKLQEALNLFKGSKKQLDDMLVIGLLLK